MARTVRDVALLLSAIAGPDPRVPNSISEPGSLFARPLDRDLRGVRVAWSPTLGGLPVDPRTLETLERSRSAFEALGCLVEAADPDLAEAEDVFQTWRAWSFAFGKEGEYTHHRDQLKDTIIWNIEAGLRLKGTDLARATRAQTRLFQRMQQFMERYEFLICPVSQVPPFPIEQPYVTEINGIAMQTYIDWMRSCYWISATSHPAISVPGGFTNDGLPVGVQIVGRYRDEFGVLQLAHAFEEATGHGLRRPEIAG